MTTVLFHAITKIIVSLQIIITPNIPTATDTDLIVDKALTKLEIAFPELDFAPVSEVSLVEDPAPSVGADSINKRFYYWELSYFKKYSGKAFANHKAIKLILSPPSTDGYIYGLACLACWQNPLFNYGTAEAAIEGVNEKGEPRTNHAILTVMHEILHVLGAKHRQGINLMSPIALAYVDTDYYQVFKIAKRTRLQVHNYLWRLNHHFLQDL